MSDAADDGDAAADESRRRLNDDDDDVDDDDTIQHYEMSSLPTLTPNSLPGVVAVSRGQQGRNDVAYKLKLASRTMPAVATAAARPLQVFYHPRRLNLPPDALAAGRARSQTSSCWCLAAAAAEKDRRKQPPTIARLPCLEETENNLSSSERNKHILYVSADKP